MMTPARTDAPAKVPQDNFELFRGVQMIDRVAVSGYRSLRDVWIAFGQLNVVTGANGSGKSSVYRALDEIIPEEIHIIIPE